MKEHYGITVPTSSARIITQQHAHEMHSREEKEKLPQSEIFHSIILGEADGTMIPMMKTLAKPVSCGLHLRKSNYHKIAIIHILYEKFIARPLLPFIKSRLRELLLLLPTLRQEKPAATRGYLKEL